MKFTKLSPAAQAVWDAFNDVSERVGVFEDYGDALAAALRAAASETLLTSDHLEGSSPNKYELGWNAAVAYIQDIAQQLEEQRLTSKSLNL